MNKSTLTNCITVLLAVVGYAMPTDFALTEPLRAVGLFATSGAITNWLAVHMLFEKVPGLYGSGVVPARFEEFKTGIRDLIMHQFFTAENVENFFKGQSSESQVAIDPEPLIGAVDLDAMFDALIQAVMGSSFGGMLGMFGGAAALDPLKEPFQENIRLEIRKLAQSPKLAEALSSSLTSQSSTDAVVSKVDAIVQQRLDELTPQMVKEIVQDMIQRHLGWLVVWGGVFGGIIGLLTCILPQS